MEYSGVNNCFSFPESLCSLIDFLIIVLSNSINFPLKDSESRSHFKIDFFPYISFDIFA